MTQVETGVAGGVSFALTPEQRELRALAREFAEKEIRPKAAEYDEHSTHPVDVIAKAHELGLMNLHVPESLGGLGLPAFDGMLVGEELNWGCSGIATSILANGLGAGPVLIAGSDEQKETWLPPLLEAPILCSFGAQRARRRLRRRAHEDDGGASWRRVRPERLEDLHHERRPRDLDGRLREDRSEQGAPRDLGVRRPDGHARRPDREAPRQDGAAVDRHLGVRPDRRRRSRREPHRRGGRRVQDRDEDARLHAARERRPAPSESRRRRSSCAVEYAKERVTFDVPIAMHQGVNFLIADMATEIEAARLLVWQSAWLHDQGERATLQSSFAKRFAADTAMKVTTDAVQVFGGYGYIKEYPVEKLMRDAKLFQIYEGTSQIQRLVIAKEIFLPRGD